MEIHVFRIWPRDDPAYVGTFNGYGGCYDLKTLDDLLYVFSSYAGLRIFELP